MAELELINGGSAVDDRGMIYFVNDFNFPDVKRFYQVSNYNTEIIRAFHGHRHEIKYVYVPKGSALVIAVPLDDLSTPLKGKKNIQRFILSERKPAILKIPEGYANGFRTLEQRSTIQFFSNRSLKESLEDDIRFDWDLLGEDIWKAENR